MEEEKNVLDALGRRSELITFDSGDDKFFYLVMDLEEGENPGASAYKIQDEKQLDVASDIYLILKLYFLILSFQAIKELHDRDLIHRDIGPHNIVVTPLKATLIDVGSVSSPDQKVVEIVGADKYNAPELTIGNSDDLRPVPYTKATDIYAAGLTAQEFLQLGDGALPKVFAPLAPLFKSMTSTRPEDRPTIDVALETLKGFYNKNKFTKARKEIDTYVNEYKQNEAVRFNSFLNQVNPALNAEKFEFKHTNLQLLNKYINNALNLYAGKRGGCWGYLNMCRFMFRWIFITSDETKEIINELREELKKAAPAPGPGQVSPEDEKRYEKAKQYILKNSTKHFAKLLYKNVFYNDFEVKEEMNKNNKKFLVP